MADWYFSRATLNPSAAADPRFWRQLSDGYGLHQLVWTWFSRDPGQERNFLFRIEPAALEGKGPTIYTLSSRPPTDRDGRFDIAVKDYAPQFAVGDCLEFEVRASPTRVNSRGPGGKAHGKRVDVVMDAKFKERDSCGEARSEAELVQSTCSEWLVARQARLGVEFVQPTIAASGYQQHRFGHGARQGSVQFSTVDLRGQLRVVEPDAFLAGVHAGLGSEKAFGCGLWMLRRAS